MSRHDDLDGEEYLTPRQRAAVDRLRGRQHRYTERPAMTNLDAWDAFFGAERAEEQQQIWKGGNR